MTQRWAGYGAFFKRFVIQRCPDLSRDSSVSGRPSPTLPQPRASRPRAGSHPARPTRATFTENVLKLDLVMHATHSWFLSPSHAARICPNLPARALREPVGVNITASLTCVEARLGSALVCYSESRSPQSESYPHRRPHPAPLASPATDASSTEVRRSFITTTVRDESQVTPQGRHR